MKNQHKHLRITAKTVNLFGKKDRLHPLNSYRVKIKFRYINDICDWVYISFIASLSHHNSIGAEYVKFLNSCCSVSVKKF